MSSATTPRLDGVGLPVFALGWLWVCWGGWDARPGVEVRQHGIRVGVGFRRHSVAWSEIKNFRVLNSGALSPSVRMELTSGQLLRTGLVQGRTMRRQGGATKDIVGVLNGEREHARSRG